LPPQALRWAERCLGAPVEVGPRLSGGIAAAVHSLTAGGHRFVLKRYRADDSGEPDQASREATSLAIAARGGIAVPEVVGLDRTGAEAGDPALLMRRLSGRHRIRPAGDYRPFVRRLLDLLPAIHAIDVTGEGLPPYQPYNADRIAPFYSGPEPDGGPRVFIHRDFHQGNVLLSGERVTGIVDWVHGCVGSAWADVAHLRANLFNFVGAEAADYAVAEFQRMNPQLPDYHPYWDVATLVSMSWPRARTLLAAAASKLP
jgi:aminoglycoside phosphotransferase (APT) family kinase protein